MVSVLYGLVLISIISPTAAAIVHQLPWSDFAQFMTSLRHDDGVMLYAALTLILLLAKVLGAISRLFRQPDLVGELLAGVLTGPWLEEARRFDMPLF